MYYSFLFWRRTYKCVTFLTLLYVHFLSHVLFAQYFIDYKLVDEDGVRTEYAMNFLSYVGYASQLPNVIFNWLNIFVQIG